MKYIYAPAQATSNGNQKINQKRISALRQTKQIRKERKEKKKRQISRTVLLN
jgi:hypothetical protein